MSDGMQAIPQQMQRLIGSAICLQAGDFLATEWQPIDAGPFGKDLQLSVIEDGDVHSLVFPCRRTRDGWLHGLTGKRVQIHPTHWRPWDEVS